MFLFNERLENSLPTLPTKLHMHAEKLAYLSYISSLQQISKLGKLDIFFLKLKILDLSFQKANQPKRSLDTIDRFFFSRILPKASVLFNYNPGISCLESDFCCSARDTKMLPTRSDFSG